MHQTPAEMFHPSGPILGPGSPSRLPNPSGAPTQNYPYQQQGFNKGLLTTKFPSII